MRTRRRSTIFRERSDALAIVTRTFGDADVGLGLQPEDGWVMSLKMTTPPIYETSVDWDPSRGIAKTRSICLQGAYDLRPIYNSDIVTSPALSGLWGPDGYIAFLNTNFPYAGALVIVSCPKGSQWEIGLSDFANPRKPPGPGLGVLRARTAVMLKAAREPRRQDRPDAQRETLLGMPLGLTGKTAGIRRNPC